MMGLELVSIPHEAGFVDTNIRVKTGGFGDGSFLVTGYDFGEVNQALDFNTTTVWRPEGTVGCATIKAEHDRDMLEKSQ